MINNIYNKITDKFKKLDLYRPMKMSRYENGTILNYNITSVTTKDTSDIQLFLEKFIGGGFAGQVYRVKILNINKSLPGLTIDGVYAMKILIPPSGFSLFFRNLLYFIGFQGSFQLQTNPDAARAGALWQKFIRCGAKIMFGTNESVRNIHATFVDNTLGSCGELSDWIEGRNWKLEVDDRLDLLKKWYKNKNFNHPQLGSPEYRSKYMFMHKFVDLLHDMGAYEFARQYEWTTCKSQPNTMKLTKYDDNPEKGHIAADFRAGLTLLPFLPMSPGDIILIIKGLLRGSLVQFDRGDLNKLENFILQYKTEFEDLMPMLDDLKYCEKIYRNSVPDITHNHFRLLYSKELWSTILNSTVTGWKTQNLIDEQSEKSFRNNKILILLFKIIMLIPLFGKVILKFTGHTLWHNHYKKLVSSFSYFKNAIQGKIYERLIKWYRTERIDDNKVDDILNHQWKLLYHIPASLLPAGLHRLLTDYKYLKSRLQYYIIRPVKLYFNAELRVQWLKEMVSDGQKNNLLSQSDADTILSKIDEPFIQKYLKSLAVHVCTLPVTQVVSVTIAAIYILTHPEMDRTQAYSIGLGIIALFQVVPLSPGSLTRGLYTLYMVIKDRNFKDYNIAIFLSFFKYVGYLAFPIQMSYRYPTLARFMASHWATEAVHFIPVFGEKGALLEHAVFNLFYNRPLTMRHRIRDREAKRKTQKSRLWHIIFCILTGTAIFSFFDFRTLQNSNIILALKEYWWLVILTPFISVFIFDKLAAGTSINKRIIGGILTGLFIGVLSTIVLFILYSGILPVSNILINGIWRTFIFTIIAAISILFSELSL